MSSPLLALDCTDNDITLNSQADVNNFVATQGACTHVVGYLFINGADITDLTPLATLTSVGNYLSIAYNASLTSLSGLTQLTSVGSFLYIGDNAALTNIDDLSGLTSVGHYVAVIYNASLIHVDGLSGLTSVVANLAVYNNTALTNLDGLSAVTSVGGFLRLASNPSLTNLNGLSAVTSVGDYLYIAGHPLLTNLGALSNLTSVGGNLSIRANGALTNVDGLLALTSVGGNLEILFNSVLTNIDGLSALISVGDTVSILDNPQLAVCFALEPLLNDIDDALPGPGPGGAGIPDVGGDVFLSGNLPSCNTVGVILGPADGTAVLLIDKIFTDGNDETPVTLRMQCDGGSYTPELVMVDPDEPGGNYEQSFVVFNIPQGGIQECTVSEDPVPGYHTISVCIPELMSDVGNLCLDPDNAPDNSANVYDLEGSVCQWTDIQEGDTNLCQILNIPKPLEVEITKVWDVVNMGGENFSKGVDINFGCVNGGEILGPDYWSLGNNDFEYIDDQTAIATVTTQVIPSWFPAASGLATECWADEHNLASGVEVESDCGDPAAPGMVLTAGGGDVGCTISNTLFFEGIPTLNQYGMAIMALLMLGMGMLGFRRFT